MFIPEATLRWYGFITDTAAKRKGAPARIWLEGAAASQDAGNVAGKAGAKSRLQPGAHGVYRTGKN